MTTALVHEKQDSVPFILANALKTAMEHEDLGYGDIILGIAKAAFGAGKVAPPEFFAMRLYDLEPDLMATFAGRRVEAITNMVCNYNRHWFAVAEDKLLYSAAMQGLGLPTPPIAAVFHPSRSLGPNVPALRSVDELEAWLRNPDLYPLFGKPNAVRWSLGAASLASLRDDTIEDLFGNRFPVRQIAEEIGRYANGGYVFQPRLDAHSALRELHGPALSTVRVFMIQDEDGPRILRTHIKIPSGKNVADNTWRAGNLAAAVDPETGALATVWQGSGVHATQVTEHPDTGVSFEGFVLPHWDQLRATMLDAASALSGLNIQGWDVAICEDGPMLIEVNADPDWATNQRLTHQGMLEPFFTAFVERCKAHGKQFQQRIKETGA